MHRHPLGMGRVHREEPQRIGLDEMDGGQAGACRR
jgi:hypothetical protein